MYYSHHSVHVSPWKSHHHSCTIFIILCMQVHGNHIITHVLYSPFCACRSMEITSSLMYYIHHSVHAGPWKSHHHSCNYIHHSVHAGPWKSHHHSCTIFTILYMQVHGNHIITHVLYSPFCVCRSMEIYPCQAHGVCIVLCYCHR